MDTEVKAKAIFGLLKPSMAKKLVNGTWRYNTEYGSKTAEGVIASIKALLEQ